MAKIKYAGEEAVSRIADYVNAKLTFASSMPVSPDTNAVILYVGADDGAYRQGGIYLFDGTDWIAINQVRAIELTQAEYDALPYAAKHNDTIYFITNANVEGSIVSGYYNENNGEFYKESTFEHIIAKSVNVLYVDLLTNTTYIYDATNDEYVQVGGGGGGVATVIEYVETLPSSNIKDIIYGYDSATDYSETTADGFLDSDTNFVKTGDTYTAANGIRIKASADGVTYKDFDSLAYDNVNTEFILTYADTTSDTLTVGDTFYWQIINRNYLAGNAEEQSLTMLAGAGGGGTTYLPGEGININGGIISVKPATASTLGGVKSDDDTLKVDANGVLSGNYEGGYNVKVDGNEISTKTFVGTQSEWDNLTSSQKAKFDTVNITDDFSTINNTPGHIILDENGNELPSRTKLKLEGAIATDDSTNDKTVITVTPYTAGDKIEITNNEVSCNETVKGTFIGTQAEWNALSTADKAKYDVVNFTDDQSNVTTVVDTIAEGNMNAVTSNAVFDAIKIGNKLTNMLGLSAHQPSENMVDIIKAICTESHPYFSASYQKLAVYFWYGGTIIYGHLYSYSYSSDNSTFGYGVHLMRISDGVVYTGYYQANGWKIYSVTPTIMS